MNNPHIDHQTETKAAAVPVTVKKPLLPPDVPGCCISGKEGSMDHNISEKRVEEEVDGGVEDDEGV